MSLCSEHLPPPFPPSSYLCVAVSVEELKRGVMVEATLVLFQKIQQLQLQVFTLLKQRLHVSRVAFCLLMKREIGVRGKEERE